MKNSIQRVLLAVVISLCCLAQVQAQEAPKSEGMYEVPDPSVDDITLRANGRERTIVWTGLGATPGCIPSCPSSRGCGGPTTRCGRSPTGRGSGALGMVGLAMLAGSSMSGRGSRRRRIAAGVLGFAAVPAWWLAPPMAPDLDQATPYGALVAMTFTALLVALAAACSVPMRATTARED